jgi:hypothetical protein
MTAQDNVKEQESVDHLMAMMGDSISDPEVARRVLRKCDGDLQKAATAILEGDRGEDRHSSPVRKTEVKPFSPPRELCPPWFILLLFHCSRCNNFWTR